MAGPVQIPNIGGALPSPLLGISEALAQAPIAAADQNAALNQKGWQTIQPYIVALSRNPNLASNNAFTGQMQRIAQMYRISGPMLNQAIDQVRAQLGGAGAAVMPGGTASTGSAQAGGAVQTGPARVAPQQGGGGAPASGPTSTTTTTQSKTTMKVGGEPDLGTQWDDPRLKQLAQIYNQDLEAAARTPALTGHPDFQQKILQDGRAVGRNSQEIAADVKAYQVKAGVGPHPETMPADQAQIRTQRQAALTQPQASQQQQQGAGGPGAPGASTPQATDAAGRTNQGSSTAQTDVSGAPPGTPGAGAAGPTTYSGPHALPPAMQALMAAAGVTPTGMQAYGTTPLDASTSRTIAESPPGSRAQLYANAGIDPTTVPADVMNAKQVMTLAQAGTEYNRMMTQINNLVKQGQDPTPAISAAADIGAITPEEAQSLMSDPNILQPLKQGAVFNMGVRLQNKTLSQAKYDELQKRIQLATTTDELQKLRAQYLGKEIQWFAPLAQAKINQANALVGRYGTLDNSDLFGNWYQQQQVGSLSTNQQVVAGQKAVNDLQTAYNNYLTTQRTAINNDEDADNVDVGGGVTLSTALANTKTALDQAKAHLNTLLKSAPSIRATSTINAGGGGMKVKPGPPPPGSKAGTKDGVRGWQWPDGSFHADPNAR